MHQHTENAGGAGGIRTLGTGFASTFISKGVLSASQPPLRLSNVWGRKYTLLQMMSIHKYKGRN